MGPVSRQSGRRLVRPAQGIPRPVRHVPPAAAGSPRPGRGHPRLPQQQDESPAVTRAVVVRYRTRPDAADDNEQLIKAVLADLAAVRPGGIRYSVLRADGTTFVHVAVFDSDANPLEALPAFQAFTSGLADRCAEPPAPV